MISARLLLAIPLAASLALATPAQAQSDPFGLFGRGDRQQPPPVQQNNPNDPSELMIRIERLESQLRQLTGVVEQLQHENQQLRAANPNAAPAQARAPNVQRPPQSGPQNNPPPVVVPDRAPNQQGDAFDPSRDPNAPGVPRQLGVVPQNPSQNQPQQYPPRSGPMDLSPNAAPPQQQQNAPGPQQQAVLPPSNSAKDAYDLAYGYVLRRDYALAEQSFRAFIDKFPDDRNVPQATYWLGESQFAQNKHNDAAETFLDVYNKHPASQRAPDSLLRLGQSLAALGKKEAACASLGAVLSKYPKASPTVKKSVADEQKRLSC